MASRAVQLESYIPDILKNVRELQEIVGTEDAELNRWCAGADDALNDNFLNYMTANGIRRWENIIGIAPAGTLDDRRKAVIIRLNEMLPFTIRRLRQMLASICGDDGYSIEISGYTLTVRIPSELYTVRWAVYDTLHRVVPANMQNIIRIVFQSSAESGIFVVSKLGVIMTIYPWQVHQYDSVSTVSTAVGMKSALTVTVLERS
jgi:hypothetical protein